MDQSIERWLPVVGWEGLYEVSDQGRVRSLDRVAPAVKGKILKPASHHSGYKHVILRNCGRNATCNIHVLVLTAFAGPRPDGAHCAHGDGDRSNNVASNLRWATAEENAADRDAHGTTVRGGRHHKARLTEQTVLTIRARYVRSSYNRSNAALLAEEFGVPLQVVQRIVHRKTWTHV